MATEMLKLNIPRRYQSCLKIPLTPNTSVGEVLKSLGSRQVVYGKYFTKEEVTCPFCGAYLDVKGAGRLIECHSEMPCEWGLIFKSTPQGELHAVDVNGTSYSMEYMKLRNIQFDTLSQVLNIMVVRKLGERAKLLDLVKKAKARGRDNVVVYA